MHTLEALQRKLKVVNDLHSVVTTMKALAAANIRQCEQAVRSLEHYSRTVEMGLRIVLRQGGPSAPQVRVAPRRNLGALVFGTDQGMCGALNDQVVEHALQYFDTDRSTQSPTILTVGYRPAARLEDAGYPVADICPVPGSIEGITRAVQSVLVQIDRWQTEPRGGLARGQAIDHVTLLYPDHISGASYQPKTVSLLPVDEQWLMSLRQDPWPTHCLPTFTLDANRLFSALIREYLFIELYRAFAETQASESAARLAATLGAERNVQERQVFLQGQYHQQRQMGITDELLDIVGGREALQLDG